MPLVLLLKQNSLTKRLNRDIVHLSGGEPMFISVSSARTARNETSSCASLFSEDNLLRLNIYHSCLEILLLVKLGFEALPSGTIGSIHNPSKY